MEEEEFWDVVSAVEDASDRAERRRALEVLIQQEHPEALGFARRYILEEADTFLVELVGRMAIRRWQEEFFEGLDIDTLSEHERISLTLLAAFLDDGGRRLADLLSNSVVRVRCVAAERLGRKRDRADSVLQTLAAVAEQDREFEVRKAAAFALGAQPDMRALPLLEAIVKESPEFEEALLGLRSRVIAPGLDGAEIEVIESEEEEPGEQESTEEPKSVEPQAFARPPVTPWRTTGKLERRKGRGFWEWLWGKERPEEPADLLRIFAFGAAWVILIGALIYQIAVSGELNPGKRVESFSCPNPRCNGIIHEEFPAPNLRCPYCRAYIYLVPSERRFPGKGEW